MNYVDILVLISVILACGLIIFFKIRNHHKGQCDSCPVAKNAKRAIKDYHKQEEKNKGEK